MIADEPVGRLEHHLGHEVEAVTQLLAVLGEEYAALQADDAHALENAVAAKHELVARLEVLGRERDKVLSEAGTDGEELEHWLVSVGHGEGSTVHRLWCELQALARNCHQQNNVNGAVVEVSQRHVQHVLALLRGQAQPTELYGRNGIASKTPSSTTFAKA
jgi:flagella synthesis protein FlgN